MKGSFLFTLCISVCSTIWAQEKTYEPEIAKPMAFPEGTVWINSDQPLQIESFSNKIMVLIFNDLLSFEGGYHIQKLIEKYKRYPQIQLIEVLTPNPALQLTRRNLVQYVHRNNWQHPVAVVPNLDGFSEKVLRIPSTSVYYLSEGRALFADGEDQLKKVSDLLDDYCADEDAMRMIPGNMVIPDIQATWFADPIVENPHRVEKVNQGDFAFIDQSHNRIIQMDNSGTTKQVIGNSIIGFANGHSSMASFNHPQGLAFHNNFLYVADTYNNAIRRVELGNGMVETFWGNGECAKEAITKNTKKILQIGIPSAITIWDGQLIVASAQTNQLFMLDPQSGDASLFLDIPKRAFRMMTSTPVDLYGGDKALYMVLSDGTAWQITKKGEIKQMPSCEGHITSICDLDGEVFVTTRQNQILKLNKTGVWEPHTKSQTTGWQNGKLGEAQFNWPQDMCEFNGQLLVADCENHQLRIVSGDPKGQVKLVNFLPTRELIQDKAANSEGELVLMDTIYVNKTGTEIIVHLNTQNCRLVPSGVNELHIVPQPGFSISKEEITENFIKFKLDGRFKAEEANLEIYLTLEDPQLPGVYLVKRTYLSVALSHKSGSPMQELVYDIHIWPY